MGKLRSLCIAAMASALAWGLAGCQGLSSGPKASVYQAEAFEQSETFSRLFDTEPAKTCDAARRALLSQGYLLRDGLRADNLIGYKNFQPKPDTHMQIEMHVTCSPDGADGQLTTLFVSALQDRYALKKSANAASLGVNAFGSLSIPLGSSDDSLVKVGSETIPAGNFYDRFFVLVDRLVREQAQTRQ